MTMHEPQTAYDLKDGQIRLARLPDGYELDPPWAYSENPHMSLGVSRFQFTIDENTSDEEIGRRVRSALFGIERKSFVDVHAFTPTSNEVV